MLTYKCKSCSFSFSEADKAWDRAIACDACPECGEKLEGFHVSEKDAEHVRKNLKDIDLLNAEKSLAESLPSDGWLYMLCLLCILFILFTDAGLSNFGGRGGGQIIVFGFFGFLMLVKFYRKRHKRKLSNIAKSKQEQV